MTAFTGFRRPLDKDGVVSNEGFAAMTRCQQVVTALMALLMLATFAMVPAQPSRTAQASELKRAGFVTAPAQTRGELPAEQVRDLAYN